MESYPQGEHRNVPSIPSLRSGASTPCEELGDKYYRQFIQGIDNVRGEQYSPTNLSMVSIGTGGSYSNAQGIRDSVFKPIREVLTDPRSVQRDIYPTGEKGDTSGDSIQSQAMIEALRSLQSKIARLETERAAAAEKFESLSSRTNQKQRDLSDNPILPDSTPEAPRLENMSFSELRAISTRDTRPHQYQTADNYEVERRLDSINEKCWQQAQELETTREMLRRAQLDRKYTEEQMSRLEYKYDELRTTSEQVLPHFQLDPELVAKRASEEAVRRVEERQREMAQSQEQTEDKVRDLQHELKLERHRRKLLQEKAAELQAAQDTSACLARATSLSSCSHLRTRSGKRKKLVSSKLSKHKHATTSSRCPERGDHYRVQLKDIPFVVGTSISQSHSVAANYQQLIAMLKSHNTAVCGRGPHGVQGRGESNKGGILPKEDSRRLIEELERELAALQIQHQQLARELQLSQESAATDSQPIEKALRHLLEQMDVKAQHVRLAKTVNKQVRSKQKDPIDSSPSVSQSETTGVTNSPPVNLYSTAPLPASNIAALRTMRNLQNTLKEEDLYWN